MSMPVKGSSARVAVPDAVVGDADVAAVTGALAASVAAATTAADSAGEVPGWITVCVVRPDLLTPDVVTAWTLIG